MNNIWRAWDDKLDINAVMDYFGYPMTKNAASHKIYNMGKDHAVVFNTGRGQFYYLCSSPEKKLRVFDLILTGCSKTEKDSSKGLWHKVDECYSYLNSKKEFQLANLTLSKAEIVNESFNHFEEFAKTLQPSSLLDDQNLQLCFQDRLFEDKEGLLYFPFYNLSNNLTGHVQQKDLKTFPIEESDTSMSVWFSQVPKKIEHLIVFNNPLEAIYFQQKFKLTNAVYLAIKNINYETSKIMVQIYKQTKVRKMMLSFTGNSKIEGYIDDLMLISCINDGKFFIKLEKDHLMIRFDPESEKAISQLHKEIQKYNQALNKEYLKFNKLVDHTLVNQKSMVLSKHREMVACKLPIEINALRYFLWSYYRNYLGKMIDIIKPQTQNWQYEHNQSTNASPQEISAFKIAV
tara:strand:+ start:5995 stop:7203 length:1209 start_codon:yes stop_codon:yes gene_type:complete